MTAIHPGGRTREPQALNRRRALRVLSALAAAAAGVAVLSTAGPERAYAYSQTEGSTDFTGPIRATGGNATVPDGAAVIGSNPTSGDGLGVYGTGDFGVWGTSTGGGGYGVLGYGSGGGGIVGVGSFGVAGTGTSFPGVLGSATNGHGVEGQARGTSYIGVYGLNSGSGVGVQGTTNSGANGQPAVLGQNSGAGPGVQGFSSGQGSIGISGGTDVGVGWGTANGSGTGVLASSITGTGLWAQSQSFFAGVFSGPVLVQGNFTVTGAKSAAVRGTDGGLKRLYSLERPESWFEDFGSAQLSGGTTTVQLESGFAGVVHGENYHVFLTPRGESKGWLYVSKQTPGSFIVSEASGGTSNIGFSYRIVAKRKDIPGARLEHVDEPPTLPDFVKTPPTPPKLPVLPDLPAMPTPPTSRPGG
jgi:hypothetical protein